MGGGSRDTAKGGAASGPGDSFGPAFEPNAADSTFEQRRDVKLGAETGDDNRSGFDECGRAICLPAFQYHEKFDRVGSKRTFAFARERFAGYGPANCALDSGTTTHEGRPGQLH